MPIKPSGSPLTTTEIQTEFGGVVPISLSEYYGLASGLPTSGQPIPMSTFYGKTFVVVERITASGSWSPKLNKARFIHIFAVGAGGSGGVSYPENRTVFIIGNQEGVGVSPGGGGGGVSYSVVAGSSLTGPINVTIGVGGAGVTTSSEGAAVDGNPGTNTSFVGSGLNMIGGGGQGGDAKTKIDAQTTTESSVATPGGVASGGNTGNFAGGNAGSVYISTGDLGYAASGGGAVAFKSGDLAFKDSAAVSTTGNQGVGAGARVSTYGTYPSILTSYPTSRSQSAILGSGITDFDGSSGLLLTNTSTGSPVYGAGSGGSCHRGSPRSGRGGNGIVIIVYEI